MPPSDPRIQRLIREQVAIVDYDPAWAAAFKRERDHLRACLPAEMIGRIEHYGSTAVPGLAAKPIIDMLVEVRDLEETKARIVPLLTAQGYEYFWRPSFGDDTPPWYAWFIKRDPQTGDRTHHIHMVEPHFTEHWDRLLFRDYLIAHPEIACEYADLKRKLAAAAVNDRVAYTLRKTEFVARITAQAKRQSARED